MVVLLLGGVRIRHVKCVLAPGVIRIFEHAVTERLDSALASLREITGDPGRTGRMHDFHRIEHLRKLEEVKAARPLRAAGADR
jgi:hypothetical protein